MKKLLLATACATTLGLGLLVSAPASANLLTNGGFETGDFTGWTLFGNTGFTGVQGNFGGVNPFDGNFQGFFGAVGSTGGIEQTFSDTAGSALTISAELYNFGGTPSEFQILLNGAPLYDNVDPGAFPYTGISVSGTATGSDTIAFVFRQDPSYFLLDDASVTSTAAPEPASVALLGVGLLGLGLIRRKRA